jgi:hypothetical protein
MNSFIADKRWFAGERLVFRARLLPITGAERAEPWTLEGNTPTFWC